MISTVLPLNLTLTDYHDPQANHIMDASDLNGDEILNVLDIVQLVNQILGVE